MASPKPHETPMNLPDAVLAEEIRKYYGSAGEISPREMIRKLGDPTRIVRVTSREQSFEDFCRDRGEDKHIDR